jgi:hypothetical protein
MFEAVNEAAGFEKGFKVLVILSWLQGKKDNATRQCLRKSEHMRE